MKLLHLTDQQRKALLDEVAVELDLIPEDAHDMELLEVLRDLSEKAAMYDGLCR